MQDLGAAQSHNHTVSFIVFVEGVSIQFGQRVQQSDHRPFRFSFSLRASAFKSGRRYNNLAPVRFVYRFVFISFFVASHLIEA